MKIVIVLLAIGIISSSQAQANSTCQFYGNQMVCYDQPVRQNSGVDASIPLRGNSGPGFGETMNRAQQYHLRQLQMQQMNQQLQMLRQQNNQ